MKNSRETTEETIRNLVKNMGMHVGAIEEHDDGIGIVRFNIRSDDARALIGQGGEALQALNLVIKKILERGEEKKDDSDAGEQAEGTLNFIIDVNDYQKERLIELKNLTKIIAERVRLFGHELPLPSMSAYERMIVHSVAKTIDGIATESRGTGHERYVVLKPKGD